MANVWPKVKQVDCNKHLAKRDYDIGSGPPFKYIGDWECYKCQNKREFLCDSTSVVVLTYTMHNFNAKHAKWLSQLKYYVKVGQSL